MLAKELAHDERVWARARDGGEPARRGRAPRAVRCERSREVSPGRARVALAHLDDAAREVEPSREAGEVAQFVGRRHPCLAEGAALPRRADRGARRVAEARAVGGRAGDLGGDGLCGFVRGHERERQRRARLERHPRVGKVLRDEARCERVDHLERCLREFVRDLEHLELGLAHAGEADGRDPERRARAARAELDPIEVALVRERARSGLARSVAEKQPRAVGGRVEVREIGVEEEPRPLAARGRRGRGGEADEVRERCGPHGLPRGLRAGEVVDGRGLEDRLHGDGEARVGCAAVGALALPRVLAPHQDARAAARDLEGERPVDRRVVDGHRLGRGRLAAEGTACREECIAWVGEVVARDERDERDRRGARDTPV
jgi:hypothetical protein